MLKILFDNLFYCCNVLFCFILWHFNHCRLSNAKSSLYIYIKYIWFVNILLITFLNKPTLILLHTIKWFQVLRCITNNLVKHRSFDCTQVKNQTVLCQTIQFSLSYLFALSLNIKQFYLTHWLDPIRCYQSEPDLTLERCQWRDTPHSRKLQD